MRLKGRKLIFISRIKRDGSGTEPLKHGDKKHLYSEEFKITCLSLTLKTYIASAFNVYVVKIKP